MTTTQIKPDTDDTTPEPETTPASQEVDQEAELRAYKRKVRIEALKASQEMEWCDSGTNERLRKLGLREKGTGIPIRVRIEAVRETVIVIDAEDEEEARAILAEDPSVVTASQVILKGWVVTTAAPLPGRDPGQDYTIGDPDDTLQVIHQAGDYSTLMCEKYNSRHGYCTLPRGHDHRQHVVGNGTSIIGAWTRTD